jgi:two-component system chemotaxis response regulator CheB
MTRAVPINVLVIDDSALVREMLGKLLTAEGSFVVTTAADPLIGLRKIERERPDVIVLDLAMPRMDGFAFMRRLMATSPIPVVVCSAMAGEGSSDAVFRALEEGAVDVIAKPRLGVRDFLEDSVTVLADAIRGAAKASLRRERAAVARAVAHDVAPVLARRVPMIASGTEIVAVGASTGGTEALRVVLEALPADAPGLVIVQHMPEAFTGAFARRLDTTCRINVSEARSGDRVTRGRALVAPGNHHLLVHRDLDGYAVEVADGPLVSRHRPSVDALFRSVASAAEDSAVGVIMTGMGADGAAGLLEMRQRGAATIAQDEGSSVVFGMPREAILRGAVDEVVPLARIASAILQRVALRAAQRARGPSTSEVSR